MGNDVVEEKRHCCVSCIVEGRHGFGPFGKVVNCHDNVLVSITRCRMTSHEVYVPFAEGLTMRIGCKRVRGAHGFFVKDDICRMFNNVDAVMKQCALEVPCRMTFSSVDIPKR